MDFDLLDQEQRELPVLTARQTRSLSAFGLLALASRILSEVLPQTSLLDNFGVDYQSADDLARLGIGNVDIQLGPRSGSDPKLKELQERIIVLVAGPADLGEKTLKWFEAAEADSLTGALWLNRSFRIYLRRLASQYYLSVALPEATTVRRVVKVQQQQIIIGSDLRNPGRWGDSGKEERESWPAFWGALKNYIVTRGSRLLQDAGMRSLGVALQAHQAVDCQSYHAELVAPAGMKVQDARFSYRPPDGGRVWASREEAIEHKTKRVLTDMGQTPVDAFPPVREEHGRLHLVSRPVPLGYNVLLLWRLVPQSTGWLMVAVPVAIVSALLQTFFAVPSILADHELVGSHVVSNVVLAVGNGGTGQVFLQNRAGLVLGFVAVAGALLLRTGEPPITKRILIFPRILITVSLASMVFGGANLFIDVSPWENLPPFGVYLSLLVAWAAVLVMVTILARAAGPIRRMRSASSFGHGQSDLVRSQRTVTFA